jgi:membrane associated rhomboid family serine protease
VPTLIDVDVDACRLVTVADSSEATSFFDEPTKTFLNSYYWHDTFGFGIGALQMVTKRRDADRWANVAVATSGALAGLAVGLFPIAFDANAARRRQRRRRAAKSS